MKKFILILFLFNCLEAKKSIFSIQNNSSSQILATRILFNRSSSFSLPSNSTPILQGNLTEFTITWEKANGSNIKYKLYRKNSSEFDTIEQVETGNLLIETENNTHKITDELSGNGNYYNLIAVENTSKLVYKKFQLEKADTGKIFLFRSITTTTGNMGGQVGAMNICTNTRNSNFSELNCTGIRPMMSFTGDELISSPSKDRFNANRKLTGVHSSTKAQTNLCTNDWTSCFPNIISANGMATVLGLATTYFFTLSTTSGNLGTFTCSNGTSIALSGNGGDSFSINNWIYTNNNSCNTAYEILCICY